MNMITIIPDDNFVNINGVKATFDFTVDANYHAIHWDGENGFIETKEGKNILLTDVEEFKDIVEQHTKRVAEDKAKREAYEASDEKAVNDFRYARAIAYPNIGDQLDAIWKQLKQEKSAGKTLAKDADEILNDILAVKAKIKKPTRK